MRQSYGPQDPLEAIRLAKVQAQQELREILDPPVMGHRVPIGRMTEDIVESESHPGTFYHLRQLRDGTWICDCPGHTYRQECKHAKRKMEERSW